MIIESIQALVTLDFGWFANIFLDNLLWVFIFFACANFLDKSKTFIGMVFLFIFFVYDMFTEFSFAQISGWSFYGAQFLAIYYVTRMFVGILAENSRYFKTHVLKVYALHWLVLYAGFNIFFGVFEWG